MKTINQIIRRHTAFRGALDLVKSAKHPYRPGLATVSASSQADRADLITIASFYDRAMARLGIAKVAYRF